MNSPADLKNEVSDASTFNQGLSRRQKLLGLAKATRDTYMPKITDSVSQLATGVSNRAFGGGDLYDEQGRMKFPRDTKITLFPSYTRKVRGEYVIDIKGWLSCPGLMTRKNRLILSLAKQITKYGNASHAVDKLESDSLNQDILRQNGSSSSDLESLKSDSSSLDFNAKQDKPSNLSRPPTNSSISSNTSGADELIKERLACFIAKSIPNAELTVVIASKELIDHKELIEVNSITDINGHFEVRVKCHYEPSAVQVKAASDETIFEFQDVMLIPNDGIGIISDIDDTIKLTGVVGDKRELMKNLLLNNVSLWSIPAMLKWYTELSKSHCTFHYVSNSPWQLYSTIKEYFNAVGLPYGSIHLKQYTGNIIASLMEPSSSRKKRALYKIVEDFPNKKFVCIGDSGEHDLEAYVDLAKSNPNKVHAIYIRYVQDSISDIDDYRILKEIKRILSLKKRIKVEFKAQPRPEEMENLIDLSDSPPPLVAERLSKLPPLIPKKPDILKGNQLVRKPPLPSRNKLQTMNDDNSSNSDNSNWKNLTRRQSQSNRSPGPSAKSTNISLVNANSHSVSSKASSNVLENLQNIYNSHNYFELEEIDKKGAQSIRRIISAIEALEGSHVELNFFTDDDAEFFQSTLELIKEIEKN